MPASIDPGSAVYCGTKFADGQAIRASADQRAQDLETLFRAERGKGAGGIDEIGEGGETEFHISKKLEI